MRTPDEWRSVIVSKTIKPNAKYACVCASDIAAIQQDARAGMIEVSELDETIAFLKDAYELATSPNRALKYHYNRLKALRNEHTS